MDLLDLVLYGLFFLIIGLFIYMGYRMYKAEKSNKE